MNLHADLGDLSEWSTAELMTAADLIGDHLDHLTKSAPLTPAQWQARMNALYERIDRRVTLYAERLAQGKISPAKFRSQMQINLQQAWTAAYRMGARSATGRSLLSPDDYQRIADLWQQQQQYLDAFAQQAKDNDYSQAYLVWRSRLYANGLHKAFWSGSTSRYNSSWLVHYIARDDHDTCGPCRFNAENGPYAPDECPMPGEDCEGFSACRCTLRYDRASAYAASEEQLPAAISA